jgi:peptidoglycan-associated lipoprotein
MTRPSALPALFALALSLSLGACSRGQDHGVNAAQLQRDATGASQGGYGAPGSQREFSARIGDTVYFTTDSTDVSAEAQQILVGQARWLSQYTHYVVLIEGHADERGTREYNLALGAKRAESTKNFLVSRGVQANRIRTVSYGKERPVAVCADISCWSQNRRAVTVLDQNRMAARN